jgi:hypothetical protein
LNFLSIDIPAINAFKGWDGNPGTSVKGSKMRSTLVVFRDTKRKGVLGLLSGFNLFRIASG